MTIYEYRCESDPPHIITSREPLSECKGCIKGRPCPYPLVRVGAGSKKGAAK